MKQTGSPRDVAQDVARGIGIVLVVFGHLQRGLIELGMTNHAEVMRVSDFVLYSTHMPLFFFLAGRNALASVRKQGPRDFLKRRPGAVLWPYFLWSILFVFAQQAASVLLSVHHTTPLSALLLIPVQPVGIFWFLQSLFFAQIMAVATTGRAALLLAFSLIADSTLSIFYADAFIPGLSLTVVHLPFFALGLVLAGGALRRPAWIDDGLLALPALCGTVGLGLIAFALRASGPVTFSTLPISCLGISAILILSKHWVHGKVASGLALLGQRSMPIYVLHIFMLPVFVRVARFLPPAADWLLLACGTTFGVAASLLAFRLLQQVGLDITLGLHPRPERRTA